MSVSASAYRFMWSVPPAMVLLSASLLGSAEAASKVGVAEAIRNSVKAVARKKERALKEESAVFRKETVSAATDSSGRFRFNDDTRLTLGPGASVTLNDVVIGPKKKSAKKFAIKATTGAFRFVSGLSEKSVYKIETPVAAIGVRGTIFDLYVAPDGTTGAVLQEGAMRVCGRSGQCTNLTKPCQFARIDPNGQVRRRARANLLPFAGLAHEAAFPFDRTCTGDAGNPADSLFNDASTGGGAGGSGGGGGGGGGNR